ncbi:PREDICTED: cell wall integrity and stress response component 3-like [Acropora digitifera]|uniref:cell wall integrity and stress response component 3-like n=1 Tax=Acropora digitifera TaxID=70779 RepID=UPI00077A6F2E|nr:PREDICTED: cell wall integrity and stress response component 3-like [Acropora digitifera]
MTMSVKIWLLSFIVFAGPDNILTSAACVDQNLGCANWASIGECKKNPFYMLFRCPVSCNVCSGCRNLLTDQYCVAFAQYCSTHEAVLRSCMKTCRVCNCCPAPTTSISVSTQPTTLATISTATMVTTPRVFQTTESKILPIPSATTQASLVTTNATSLADTLATAQTTLESTKNISGRRQERALTPGLLVLIIVGILLIIGAIGLSLFCVWRRKQSHRASNKPRSSPPPPSVHKEDSISSATKNPLYHQLERPDSASPKTHEDSSVQYEKPENTFRSNTDLEDALYQESWNPSYLPFEESNCKEEEESLDYAYIDVVADEKVVLKDNNSRSSLNRKKKAIIDMNRPSSQQCRSQFKHKFSFKLQQA